jgi:uncharacterized protein (DUF433 family)
MMQPERRRDMVDWSKCDAVERLPGKLSGQWVVRGTRIGVDAVLDNAADGYAPDELSSIFPGLREEDAARIIAFAGQAADAHTA